MGRADDDSELAGRRLETAVEHVESTRGVGRETARTTLHRVTEDGVVSVGAFERALSETAKVLSTAETRTELAVSALEDARAAAEPVAGVDVVQSRLNDLAAGVEDSKAALDETRSTLGSITSRDGGVTYTAVRRMREVHGRASST